MTYLQGPPSRGVCRRVGSVLRNTSLLRVRSMVVDQILINLPGYRVKVGVSSLRESVPPFLFLLEN